MAKAEDIRLEDESGDLYINPVSGDFEISPSDTRSVQLILDSYAGHWKQFPLVGVGMKRKLSATGSTQLLSRAIKLQMKADGFRIDNVTIKDKQVYLTGERKTTTN